MSRPDAARPFDERAKEYDSWYDKSLLFDIELEALHPVQKNLLRPALEVGVGPGRFAQALGIDFGLDPALSPLQLAHRRSIMAINGSGEQLPVQTRSIGTVYLLFTLCFLTDPVATFREFFRILKPGGFMVIGLIPAQSPWGLHLARKGQEGHPFYRFAHFQTIAATLRMIGEQGFDFLEAWSTLFQPPSQTILFEHPVSGVHENAGFCVIKSQKIRSTSETC